MITHLHGTSRFLTGTARRGALLGRERGLILGAGKPNGPAYQ